MGLGPRTQSLKKIYQFFFAHFPEFCDILQNDNTRHIQSLLFIFHKCLLPISFRGLGGLSALRKIFSLFSLILGHLLDMFLKYKRKDLCTKVNLFLTNTC